MKALCQGVYVFLRCSTPGNFVEGKEKSGWEGHVLSLSSVTWPSQCYELESDGVLPGSLRLRHKGS